MHLRKIVLGAVMAVSASIAAAQESPPIPLTLTTTGAGMLGTTFERSVSGLFVDVFTFTPASVAGGVSVVLTPLDSSVHFFSALLGNEGFSFLPESGATNFSFSSVVDAKTPLSLTVFGFAGNVDTLAEATGRYSGKINVQTVAAVPEPETYALLVCGLAVLGAAVRRRRAGHSCAGLAAATPR